MKKILAVVVMAGILMGTGAGAAEAKGDSSWGCGGLCVTTGK